MSFAIDVVYDHGVLRPLEPLALPEGARIRAHLETGENGPSPPPPARMMSPRLVHPEQAADFVMQVREVSDAGV